MASLDSERLKSGQEYKNLNPKEVADLNKELQNNPLWYLPDSPVGKLLDESPFWGEESDKPVDWDKKWEVFRLVHEARMEGRLALGNKNEFKENFNDDDRWCPENWDSDRNVGINRFTKELNTAVEKPHPDTVIIHHTNTPTGFSLEFFNTLAMLRLYVPLARGGPNGGFPGYGGKNYPLNSGHYDKDGKMLFHGYHYYVEEDGAIHQVTREDETGFHSGKYATDKAGNKVGSNIRSWGIALIGDFTGGEPTAAQIKTVKELIEQLKPEHILGHQDVEVDGERPAHNCPGEHTWDNWKQRLIK